MHHVFIIKAPFSYIPIFFKTFNPVPHPLPAVGFFECADNFGNGNVRKSAVEFQILHEFPLVGIVRLKQGILAAGEFQRGDTVFPAKFFVEVRLHY